MGVRKKTEKEMDRWGSGAGGKVRVAGGGNE